MPAEQGGRENRVFDLRKPALETTRREMFAGALQVAASLAALGLLPEPAQAAWSAAAFESRSEAEALRALGLAAPTASADVSLTGLEIAENGASVPFGLACSAPGVKRLLLLVQKNPFPLAAAFDVSEAVEPSFSLRVKMSESSPVTAVAVMGDGRVLYARKDVKVTLGGCG